MGAADPGRQDFAHRRNGSGVAEVVVEPESSESTFQDNQARIVVDNERVRAVRSERDRSGRHLGGGGIRLRADRQARDDAIRGVQDVEILGGNVIGLDIFPDERGFAFRLADIELIELLLIEVEEDVAIPRVPAGVFALIVFCEAGKFERSLGSDIDHEIAPLAVFEEGNENPFAIGRPFDTVIPVGKEFSIRK